MKVLSIIAIAAALFIGTDAGALELYNSNNNYYYGPLQSPLGTNFVLNPSAYMGPACVTCSLPPPSPARSDITKQQVIPVYDNSGQLEGRIVHGIYEPSAPPTPPRPYGQTVRSYSVSPSEDPQHPNWHIIEHR